ncbi:MULTISPECIES: signal recognition particle protein [Tistrella]|uniref:Signal recognition particle protein n=1 Tax=Tistrella mobilis (strain KA081020-065) TaxID=1110502 RepID=I3TQP7_TISMK|nr:MULTISPECIES: signal recognition particle protein [Tistrella]AFK55085.1 signal recognition particle, subunit SRP54 [Tistrella mobilis KA081020-065]MAD36922.1 signal recognition particle protein [Tistrella sp.]
MFENLTGRLGEVFDRLKRRGALTEADVTAALREVRIALLEADVALPVVKDFISAVRERAVGQEVLRGINPAQMVIKIVHDHLTDMLGGDAVEVDLNAPAPVAIMMVGLQGSGKTTTSAKLARRFRLRDKKRVLLASLDVYRPAAQQQLEVLAKQAEVGSLPIVFGEKPVAIAERAMKIAAREGYDVVILDTAGRLHIDDVLMDEVAAVKSKARPHETILVADAMTGQDAVTIAKTFQDRVGLTGIALTRVDGDARGGAALAMRSVTGKPIKLLGQGEKLDQLETFHPERIASRILGMGDVVSLVEKAAETIDREEAEKLAAKIQKGTGFDLDDMAKQLRQLRKMGGMKGMLGMLPGVAKMKAQLNDAKLDEKILVRQEAIIMSMTPKERRNPEIIKASRKKRIAAGSGSSVQDVNKLLKQHQDMAKMMKQVGKLGKKGMMRGGLQNLLPRM